MHLTPDSNLYNSILQVVMNCFIKILIKFQKLCIIYVGTYSTIAKLYFLLC